jgi:hypothetical protein
MIREIHDAEIEEEIREEILPTEANVAVSF